MRIKVEDRDEEEKRYILKINRDEVNLLKNSSFYSIFVEIVIAISKIFDID